MDLSFNQIKSIGSNVFSIATNINLNSIRVRTFDSKWFNVITTGTERSSGAISFQQNKVWCSCEWIIPALELIKTLQLSNVTCRTRGSPGWKAQIDIKNFECDFDGSGESQTDDDSNVVTTSTASTPQDDIVSTTQSTTQSTTPRVSISSDLEFDVEIDQSSIDSDNILDPKQSPIVIFDSQDVTSDSLMSSRSIFDDDFEESGDWIDPIDEDVFESDPNLFDDLDDVFDNDLVDNDPFAYDISEDFIEDEANAEEKSEMSDLEFESLIEMLELHFTNVETKEIKVSTTPSYSDVELLTTIVADNPMKTTAYKDYFEYTLTSSEDTTATTTGTTSASTATTTVTTNEMDETSSTEASTASSQPKIPPQRRPLFSFVQHHSREDVDEKETDVTTTSTTTKTPMKTTMSPKQKRILRQEKIREKAAQRRERDRQRAIDAKKKREARIQKEKVKRVNAAIDKAERTWAAKQIAAIKKDVKIEKENQANAFNDFKVRIIINITIGG